MDLSPIFFCLLGVQDPQCTWSSDLPQMFSVQLFSTNNFNKLASEIFYRLSYYSLPQLPFNLPKSTAWANYE